MKDARYDPVIHLVRLKNRLISNYFEKYKIEMNQISFTSLEYYESTDAKSIGKFSLDLPKLKVYKGRFEMAGWVINESGRKLESIDLCLNYQRMARAKINVERPDVSKEHPDCGFHIECSIEFLPAKFSLDVCANIIDERNRENRVQIPLAKLNGEYLTTLEPQDSKRTPLLVTGMGRSGTTLLMETLLSNEYISGDLSYPFETRPAAYHLHLYQLMCGVSDYNFSVLPDGFEYNQFKSGRNPYFHKHFLLKDSHKNVKQYLFGLYKKQLQQSFISVIDDLYDAIDLDCKKSRTKYFAEKYLPSNIQYGYKQFYKDVKEIFIVRDFRDLLASAISFNKRRGRVTFGRDMVDSDFEWIDRMRTHGVEALMSGYKERGSESLLVRYEDLVGNSEETIGRIFEYLEIEISEEKLRNLISDVKGNGHSEHITAGSVKQTVGRWKRDLPQDLQEHCSIVLGDALSVFGYEI